MVQRRVPEREPELLAVDDLLLQPFEFCLADGPLVPELGQPRQFVSRAVRPRGMPDVVTHGSILRRRLLLGMDPHLVAVDDQVPNDPEQRKDDNQDNPERFHPPFMSWRLKMS